MLVWAHQGCYIAISHRTHCTHHSNGMVQTTTVMSLYLSRYGLSTFMLTQWGRGNMAAVSQTVFSNAFYWMKIYEFRLARAVMHVGIANLRWRGNVPGIPGACATRNFTYLARGPWRWTFEIAITDMPLLKIQELQARHCFAWFPLVWVGNLHITTAQSWMWLAQIQHIALDAIGKINIHETNADQDRKRNDVWT